MRPAIATGLLGVACTVLAAVPLGGTGRPGVLLVVVAATCTVAGVLRLLRKDVVAADLGVMPGLAARAADSVMTVLQWTDWETGAAVAIVVLEALHHARPWHTGVVAAATVCYLLSVHRAESPIAPDWSDGRYRVLLASLALLVVATLVAMVPSGAGALTGWLEIVAAVAAMAAGALALPA